MKKRVYPHFDGQIAQVLDKLAMIPFAGIESLTEPPEGDVSWKYARAALPGKVLWANINVGHYALPAVELQRWVQEHVDAVAPDKRGLALEISEDLPANLTAIPMLLDALQTPCNPA